MKIEFYGNAFMAFDPVYRSGDVKSLFILIIPLSFSGKPERVRIKAEKRKTCFFSRILERSNQAMDAYCSVKF